MKLKQLAWTLVLAVPVLAVPVLAQDPMQAKLDKKLAKDFIKQIEWVQEYDAAKAKAAADDKLILAYFTRSYAP